MTPTARGRQSTATIFFSLAAAAVFSVLLGGAEAGHDPSDCSVAQTAFAECISYVGGLEDELPPNCCRALADIAGLARTARQRRAVCGCLLSEMLVAGELDAGRAEGLPAACGQQGARPFIPTGPGFDCSRIH